LDHANDALQLVVEVAHNMYEPTMITSEYSLRTIGHSDASMVANCSHKG
jgi:hypothetical protein